MGRQSKYTREVLAEAVAGSTSIAGVLRHLGIPASGGMHAHISRRIKILDLDTAHFTGQAHRRGVVTAERLPAERILVLRPAGSRRTQPYLLRRALIELGVPYECSSCGIPGYWNRQPLILHVDHIDGNHLDSRPGNVRFLCPNCHSQTPSWAGRNKNARTYRHPPVTAAPAPAADLSGMFDEVDGTRAS